MAANLRVLPIDCILMQIPLQFLAKFLINSAPASMQIMA